MNFGHPQAIHHGQHLWDVARDGRTCARAEMHPELEVFDTGHLMMVEDLIRVADRSPPLIQLCAWGFVTVRRMT